MGQVKGGEGFISLLSAPSTLPPPALSCPARAACPSGAGMVSVEPKPFLLGTYDISPGPWQDRPHDKKCRKLTNLEPLDIPVAGARINRAWRRAARSCPRANTALCQIGNCFCRGRVCTWWQGKSSPRPLEHAPHPALTSVLTNCTKGAGGGGMEWDFQGH